MYIKTGNSSQHVYIHSNADSMNYQNLMKPKEVVAGGWPDTTRGEGRMLLNLITWKAQAAK
ncbi:hypothetical protein OIU77_003074 [Salix suchowensis]|uniref:Uncharacterized protein n=1 Tax=Salix suchowensis TaxID=1278906 RepID=A0ABQ9AYC6_9ROSI|nr:hypothetical protein OIU77_003074 [Salix suchowensis]